MNERNTDTVDEWWVPPWSWARIKQWWKRPWPAGRVGWFLVRAWPLVAVIALNTGKAAKEAADGFPIVRLELAGTVSRTPEVQDSIGAIRSAIGADWLFIVFYVTALFLGAIWASQYFTGGMGRKAGTVVASGALLAGIFDVVENFAILRFLESPSEGAIQLSTAMAGPKFVLVLFALLYILAAIAFFVGRITVRIWYWFRFRKGRTSKAMNLVKAERQDADGPAKIWPWSMAGHEGGIPYVDRSESPSGGTPRVAICSSGGGIRSATYSLGAIQAVMETGKKVDYLVGVSGGAYIASAWKIVDRFLTDDERKKRGPFAHGSPETENFRNNANYLAPTTAQKFAGAGRILLGLGFSMLLIGSLVVMLGRPWGAIISSDPLYPVFRQPTGEVAVAADRVQTTANDLVVFLAPFVEDTSGADDLPEEAPDNEAIDAAVSLARELGLDLRDQGADLIEAARTLENASEPEVATDQGSSPGDFQEGFDQVISVSRTVGADAEELGSDVVSVATRVAAMNDQSTTTPETPPEEGTEPLMGPALLSERAESLAQSAATLADTTRNVGTPTIPFEGGWLPIITAVGLGVGFGIVSIMGFWTTQKRRSWQKLIQGIAWYLIVTGFFLLLTIVAVPFLFVSGWSWLVDQGRTIFSTVQVLGAGVIFAGALRAMMSTRRSLLASVAGGVIAPLLLLIAAVNVSFGGARANQIENVALAAIAAFVFIGLYAVTDLNAWSAHPFYRRKLATVFAVKRTRGSDGRATVEEVTEYDDLKLSTYSTSGRRPRVIICAAVNVSDAGATPTSRGAFSFTFSGDQITAPNSQMGSVSTQSLEQNIGAKWRKFFTVPAAVAISGAAFSPSMGKATRPAVRALMALANLRLGVWLPRPDLLVNAGSDRQFVDRPRTGYFFREMFGIHRQDAPFVYVTDGGHWENLGLVEALRRRCTEIWVFDAAGNPPDDFSTLGEAIAMARAEPGIGVDIDIDPLPIRPAKPGSDTDSYRKRIFRKKKITDPIISPNDHLVHNFTYRDDGSGNPLPGKIIYCKAAVTADAPWDVRAYQEANPEFPSHSTLDQFFDDAQFEAYRALGYHTASRAIESLQSGG